MEWHDLQADKTDMPYLDLERPGRSYDVLCEIEGGKYAVMYYSEDSQMWVSSDGFHHNVRAWADIEPRSQKTAKAHIKLQTMDVKNAMAYLRMRGVPKSMLVKIYESFVDAALREADDMKVDRIYTAFGLAIHRAYGFGYKRIKNTFRKFSELMNRITDEGSYWDELMDELYQETGMVIHSASDYDRICVEYRCPAGEIEETPEEVNNRIEDMIRDLEEDAANMKARRDEA